MSRSIIIGLMCAATLYLVPVPQALAQRGGLGGRAGAVRYAARVVANQDDNEPWNAGFGSAPGYATAPKEIATVNASGGSYRGGAAPSPYRINYGSIESSGAAMAAVSSSGDPVWDIVAMSNYLAKQQYLTLEITVTTERASEAGQKIQLSSRQVTYVQRPDKLAVEINTDKSATRIVYDGSGVSVVETPRNLYGTIAVQGTLESVLDTLAREYGMAVPANDLICRGRYERIKEKIKFAQELGRATIDGRSYSHSVFSNDDVDFQTWIESREHPMPRRVLIIYKNQPGRPRCTLDITRCETGPIPASVFTTAIPAGAQEIRIAPH